MRRTQSAPARKPRTASRLPEPASARGLDDALRFMRLIWAVDHELERVSKRMETRLGLTIPQRMSLLLVGHNPGILASELARVLHLHRATLSGIIRRLRASGYLDGTVNKTDGRRVSLTLTASGRAINRQRAGTFEEAVRRLIASTRQRDRVATERVLARLGAELCAIAEPGKPRRT
jgi:MarR family transcriptional regulator, organic hydroperoxide resistance regulator